MIKTGIFKADKTKFSRLLFERHGQGWLFGGFFLLIAAILLGFLVDYRIFILAVMLVCLIAPAFLLILYYKFGMTGENFLNVLDHRIEIDSDNLYLYLKIKGEEEVEENREEGIDEKMEKGCEEEWRRYAYPLSCFGQYSVGKDYVVFPFRLPKEGFLYLPVSAFENKSVFVEAVKRINEYEDN